MIQVFKDSELIYDSRLPDTALLGLSVELGLSKSGAAYIELPPEHFAYNGFVGYKSVVEMYRV